MCGISYHFFEHKASRNSIEIAAAPADSHGGDHTAQFVAASQGGGGGGGGGGGAVNCQCIYVYCSFGARDITLVCS